MKITSSEHAYCGLVYAKIRASGKDLPVQTILNGYISIGDCTYLDVFR